MLFLVSPSKSLNFEQSNRVMDFSEPLFEKNSEQLISILNKKSAKSIQKLMSISDKLANLNYDRFQAYDSAESKKNKKQAVLAFTGDVYTGLQADTFNKTDYKYAQKHLRILSGLYGLLKPLDAIQPYRLEMGTDLKNKKGKNLYHFWGDQITEHINDDLSSSKKKLIINLASKEYFKVLNKKLLSAEILDIDFREYRGDDLKFISFNAKKARGMMCHYAIKNRIKKADDLKGFDYEDYRFSKENSTDSKWCFVR